MPLRPDRCLNCTQILGSHKTSFQADGATLKAPSPTRGHYRQQPLDHHKPEPSPTDGTLIAVSSGLLDKLHVHDQRRPAAVVGAAGVPHGGIGRGVPTGWAMKNRRAPMEAWALSPKGTGGSTAHPFWTPGPAGKLVLSSCRTTVPAVPAGTRWKSSGLSNMT